MISIIVPVYKTEKYLHRCIDSILAQKYKDWELILVDDGSPDSSGKICDDYASKDTRIKVFHKGNGGVSSARNVGLDNANGEWICFIDADDYINENYLEAVNKSSADIIVLESKRLCLNGQVYGETKLELMRSQDTESYRNIMSSIMNLDIMKAPWGKIIRAEKIMGIRFNLGQKIGEDTLFMMQYYKKASSIEVFHNHIYYWQNDGVDDIDKYKLSANDAIKFAKNLLHAYQDLDISCPRLERLFYRYYFSLIDKRKYREIAFWFEDNELELLRKSVPLLEEDKRSLYQWQTHPFIESIQYFFSRNILKFKKVIYNMVIN